MELFYPKHLPQTSASWDQTDFLPLVRGRRLCLFSVIWMCHRLCIEETKTSTEWSISFCLTLFPFFPLVHSWTFLCLFFFCFSVQLRFTYVIHELPSICSFMVSFYYVFYLFTPMNLQKCLCPLLCIFLKQPYEKGFVGNDCFLLGSC